MKRIFEDSKLAKTSIFYSVDYLNESDTKYWLNHLDSESAITLYKLSAKQIEMIWKYFGGSMWEISSFLGELLGYSKDSIIPDNLLDDRIQHIIKGNCARFEHYAGISIKKISLLKEIYKLSEKKNSFRTFDLRSLADKKAYDNTTLQKELNKLVQLNYLAFNPTTSTYQLQGKSMFYGLEKFVESMPDDIFVQTG
ncbi:MAG: hypothetical protein OMM_03954 [Candidatus Magnetoglobus multicellularis str. Araruama]|uniref:ATPase n=1 Tax=Candidatus Magnetoglobus multicellularis str. Araruama TaxID=890399 RepID=A0A1V1P3S7_9BACT|nr:MAG: hypothetical protein OMM_03954 [Candidatus Magnetoglobus multicellularis str. Araruama]